MKRFFDVVLSAIGLLLVWPLLLAAAAWITLDSRGPILYCGTRAGKFGRPFRMFKLRTMVPDAERLGGAETPADDPRLTRAGKVLRRFKIDELPQLFNVLKGDMSIVGPRPEVMEEVANYSATERQLLIVRPGITDWASIKFRHEDELLRGNADPHRAYHEWIRPEKIRLGLEYVKSPCLLTDCKIILATIRALFRNASSVELDRIKA